MQKRKASFDLNKDNAQHYLLNTTQQQSSQVSSQHENQGAKTSLHQRSESANSQITFVQQSQELNSSTISSQEEARNSSSQKGKLMEQSQQKDQQQSSQDQQIPKNGQDLKQELLDQDKITQEKQSQDKQTTDNSSHQYQSKVEASQGEVSQHKQEQRTKESQKEEIQKVQIQENQMKDQKNPLLLNMPSSIFNILNQAQNQSQEKTSQAEKPKFLNFKNIIDTSQQFSNQQQISMFMQSKLEETVEQAVPATEEQVTALQKQLDKQKEQEEIVWKSEKV